MWEIPFHLAFIPGFPEFSFELVAFRTLSTIYGIFVNFPRKIPYHLPPPRKSRNLWLSSHPFLSLEYSYEIKQHLYIMSDL